MGSNGSGGGQFWSGVTNMNGTFDFNGVNEGITTLTGSGTITNNAASTTSVLTIGYTPGGMTGGSVTYPGIITDGLGTMSIAVSGCGAP